MPAESLEKCNVCGKHPTYEVVVTYHLGRPLYLDGNTGYYLSLPLGVGMCDTCYGRFSVRGLFASFLFWIFFIPGVVGVPFSLQMLFDGKTTYGLLLLAVSVVAVLGSLNMHNRFVKKAHETVFDADVSDFSRILHDDGWIYSFSIDDYDDRYEPYGPEDLCNTINAICEEGYYCLYDDQSQQIVRITPDNMQEIYDDILESENYNDG